MKPMSGCITGCPRIRNTVLASPVASLMHCVTSLSWSSPWASVVPMSYVSGVIPYSGKTHAIRGATLLT